MNDWRGPWRDRQPIIRDDFITTQVKLQPDRAIEQMEAHRARLLLTGMVQLPTVPVAYQQRFSDALRQFEPPDETAAVHFRVPTQAADNSSPAVASAAYVALLDEIAREVPGWQPATLPAPLRADDISALAAKTPTTALVYLQLRESETVALIATAERRSGLVFPLKFDQLLELRLAVHSTIDRREGILAHFIKAGVGNGFNQERFAAAMEASLQVLSNNIWAQLDEELQRLCIKRLILLPDSFLALFPLHAAPLPVPHKATSNKSPVVALERYTIGYAPSAQIYALSLQERDKRRSSDITRFGWSALAIDLSSKASKPASVAPIRAIAAQDNWGVGRILWTSQADQQLIAASWSGAWLLHIHVHGEFSADDPQNTAIELAETERLTTRDILGLHGALASARIAVLAVCEGGEVEMQIAPQFRGLAGAFLEVGVPVVLAAPWRLNEPVTTLLLCRLYEGLGAGLPVADALRQAQLWLRNASHPKLQAEIALRMQALEQEEQKVNRRNMRLSSRVLESFSVALQTEREQLQFLRNTLSSSNTQEVLDALWDARDKLREQNVKAESTSAGSLRLQEILETLCNHLQQQQMPNLAELDSRLDALLEKPYGAAHYWSGLQAIGASMAPAI